MNPRSTGRQSHLVLSFGEATGLQNGPLRISEGFSIKSKGIDPR
jgi:hypothetical protein